MAECRKCGAEGTHRCSMPGCPLPPMKDTEAQSNTTDLPPEFKATVDAVIAAGHTCQSVLSRLDARLAKTPPGTGRDNLVKFRHELVEKIKDAGAFWRVRHPWN